MSTPTPHQTVVEDAAAKIAALEHALELATNRVGSDAEIEAGAIVAAARKEAFQLITEARKEAGLVIAEARSEAEQFQQFQQQPPQAADPAPAPAGGGTEAPHAEELRLEARIVELQATLAGLESGIRSLTGMLATSSGTQPVEAPAAPRPPATRLAEYRTGHGAGSATPPPDDRRTRCGERIPPGNEPPVSARQTPPWHRSVVAHNGMAVANPGGGVSCAGWCRRAQSVPHRPHRAFSMYGTGYLPIPLPWSARPAAPPETTSPCW